MDYDDKEDLEQIDEKTQRIYAYLKALQSGVLFIAWCFMPVLRRFYRRPQTRSNRQTFVAINRR
jgi:hypothetical protein